jgi:hypothetical protein
VSEIRAATVLPADRKPVTLTTADGLRLVGELALPLGRPPVATLIFLHPLPTAGGMMDSHLLRKAAFRLPALADLAVLRFNTRGTSSAEGTSEGEFGDADLDRWAASGKPLLALVPELDDFLRPDEAAPRFARVPQARMIAVARARHLWVGEPYVRIVLSEIVRQVNPPAWPLPTDWED